MTSVPCVEAHDSLFSTASPCQKPFIHLRRRQDEDAAWVYRLTWHGLWSPPLPVLACHVRLRADYKMHTNELIAILSAGKFLPVIAGWAAAKTDPAYRFIHPHVRVQLIIDHLIIISFPLFRSEGLRVKRSTASRNGISCVVVDAIFPLLFLLLLCLFSLLVSLLLLFLLFDKTMAQSILVLEWRCSSNTGE